MRTAFSLLALSAAVVYAEGIVIAYPTPFTVVQRDAKDKGVIPLRGKITPPTAGATMQARFAGGPWVPAGAQDKDGAFQGSIPGATGQGALEIRQTDHPAVVTKVAPVAIGDVFVITGQSNADGRGGAMVQLKDDLPCLGAKYRAGAWSRGDDPSDNAGKHASPWPLVLNSLIPETKIPMAFIQTATGSTVVRQWRGSGNMFVRMQKMVHAATGGTMRVRAVLYYQGENDITHWNKQTVLGDYAEYKKHLIPMLDDTHALLKAPILVGQITNLLGFRDRNDNIRRAQQEVWTEHPHALPGATAWDIFPTDGVHYRTADNMAAFAARWTSAIRNALYAEKPIPSPRLLKAKRDTDTTLSLHFARELAIAKWDGTAAKKALGFRFSLPDGTVLTDAHVTSTVVDGKTVQLRLAKPVPAGTKLSYGSGADGQGKPVLRDHDTGQPVPLVFGHAIE